MKKLVLGLAAATMLATPAFAAEKGSSSHQQEQKGIQQIPQCGRKIGTVAIVEPDNQWWREFNLGSPEAILKVFIQQSAVSAW